MKGQVYVTYCQSMCRKYVVMAWFKSNQETIDVSYLTTHLISVERVDWPKLHDMFKARDAKAWQCEFPLEFPVRVCASNLLLIMIFLDIVARIESKCVMKAKYVLLVC